MKSKKETIFVFGAHTDDFVIGAGGTIANYIKKGKKVISIIFSYGEKSHPWIKEEVVQQFRSQETFAASKILGCKIIFFDLKELKFQQDYDDKDLELKLLDLFEKEKPVKVFTHSFEDPHPDHKAVYQITLDLMEKIQSNSESKDQNKTEFLKKDYLKSDDQPELYIYSVWNPVSFQTHFPSFYVNITHSFWTKLEALKTFRSQQVHITYPFLLLLFRAIKDGLKIRTLFAEKFYRIK